MNTELTFEANMLQKMDRNIELLNNLLASKRAKREIADHLAQLEAKEAIRNDK
jgi:hypothetical protein